MNKNFLTLLLISITMSSYATEEAEKGGSAPKFGNLPLKDLGSPDSNADGDIIDLNSIVESIKNLKTISNSESQITEKIKEYDEIINKIPAEQKIRLSASIYILESKMSEFRQ